MVWLGFAIEVDFLGLELGLGLGWPLRDRQVKTLNNETYSRIESAVVVTFENSNKL